MSQTPNAQAKAKPAAPKNTAAQAQADADVAAQEPNLDGPDPDAIELDGRMLIIRSIAKQGRRRAGLAFTPEATPVDPTALTADQIAALLGDPQLVVEID